MGNTLTSRLRAQGEDHPDRTALIDAGRAHSFASLLETVRAAATRLAGSGVGPGSRIAIMCPNGTEFVVSLFAIAHVGGLVVPLNPELREAEIASIIRDVGVSRCLATNEFRDRCTSALRSAGTSSGSEVLSVDDAGLSPAASERPQSGQWPPERAQPQDPVVCLYSSGSTGRPKRVERSHANLLDETERLVAALGLSASDRVLGVAPFSHVNGLTRSLIASLLSGASLVAVPRFERRSVARLIEDNRISVFIGVPFMFAMLAETQWSAPVDFSSLRVCISASAPLRRDTARRFHERYGIFIRQLYGTTETGTIAVNLAPDVAETLDSVGMPLSGVTVEVFSGDRRLLPAGEVGEIGIRSPAAAIEYPGSPDETRQSFLDGYFFPGDIGRKDAAGRIYLLGRISLFINRGGYKVNPLEVEELIQQHPKVREVAVVGVESECADQKVKAVVVSSEPCEPSEIIEFCREKIAPFKIPSIVEFRAELPKSGAGKILRKAL